MNTYLSALDHFADWVEANLTHVNDAVWNAPIETGKWNRHQLLAHLYYWDKYTLEEMVPLMKPNASLQFIKIQELNNQAIEFSRTIDKSDLIATFLETRRKLVKTFEMLWDENLIFMLDGHPSSQIGYLNIFIHHDQEHQSQLAERL